MNRRMRRRDFLRTGAAAGAAALVGGLAGARGVTGQPSVPPDLAVVKGTDYFAATRMAIDTLGGIKKFVTPGAKVGLLINAPLWWRLPGSHTRPDIALAAILACQEAGAGSIHYLTDPAPDYWSKTPLSAKYSAEIASVQKCSKNFVEVAVPKGTALKKAKVIKELFDCDVFINLPIIKNHEGVSMSGNLKNMMGANTGDTNQFFHNGSGTKGDYGDIPFISQCIADHNTLRRPALCIADATVFLMTNGPQGPGELRKLDKVVAGIDPVAVDAYGAVCLDLKPADVPMINKAAELGLGRMDLDKLAVEEIALQPIVSGG
ncbi:MAG: DUF362 domain-containing protein [Candidatus Aminicenantes bacterium]|nr:DUF362 domain-containing protein [Candidatus Aminicenantes bacterium]